MSAPTAYVSCSLTSLFGHRAHIMLMLGRFLCSCYQQASVVTEVVRQSLQAVGGLPAPCGSLQRCGMATVYPIHNRDRQASPPLPLSKLGPLASGEQISDTLAYTLLTMFLSIETRMSMLLTPGFCVQDFLCRVPS